MKRRRSCVVKCRPYDPFDPLQISGVIGDVLQSFTSTVTMELCYENMVLINGSTKKPSEVAMAPVVQVGGDVTDGLLYTLIMVDPDFPSPSRPVQRELLLWLVTDIPAGLSSAIGTQVVEYMAPDPQIGIHRYVFVLFKQKQPLEMLGPVPPRENFSTQAFAASIGMDTPAAAVFFNSGRERAPRSGSHSRR